MEKVNVTWEDVEKFVDDLYSELYSVKRVVTGVYGIPRGGTVLAALISYSFNIPLLAAPCDGCIIIDDIADSGRSLCHYTENDTQFNKYFIATMYYCKRSVVKPDYYKYEKEDKWITFPWERGERVSE